MTGLFSSLHPAFAGLSNLRFGQRLQQPAPVAPKFGNFTFQEECQDAFAYVERAERKAEAAQVMFEPRPHWDYVRNRYNAEDAGDFADAEYDLGGADIRGREFLEALMTPKTIDPLDVPDRDRLTAFDYAQAGVPENAIRAWAEEKILAFPRVYQLLKLAQREGLVYELYDDNTKVTYYGLPPRVRQDLGLTAPATEEAGPAGENTGSAEDRRQFQQQLGDLFEQAATLADPDDRTSRELMEYVTLIGEAATEAGLIQSGEIPGAFDAFRGLSVDERLDSGLLTLYEFCQDTDMLKQAATALCKTAAKLGILDPDEFREIAGGYGEHPLLDVSA